jgi:hypothetical protein
MPRVVHGHADDRPFLAIFLALAGRVAIGGSARRGHAGIGTFPGSGLRMSTHKRGLPDVRVPGGSLGPIWNR